MAGARPFWVSIVVVAMFFFVLIMFANLFLNANTPSNPMMEDVKFKSQYQGLNKSLNALQSNSEGWYDVLKNDKPSVTFVFLVLASIASLPFTMFASTLGMIKSMLSILFENILGPEFGVIIGILTSIALVVIIFIIVKIIRIGETER